MAAWSMVRGFDTNPAETGGYNIDWGDSRLVTKPADPWEVTGYVNNVVFTCGAVPEVDGTVKIYWGGADQVMCVGTAKIDDLVDLCLKNPRPAI